MPLWHVYHPRDTYSPEQKQRMAADITGIYTRFGLPEFYVMTLFHEIGADAFHVGTRPTQNAVRIVVEHIARHTEEPDLRRRTREALAAVLAPHTTERGLYCEFHIDETPRDLWMMDGISPPPTGSEAEQLWARENRPLPY
ncbi:tautomerase family protein [Streptomyces sp. CBMA123]|uniref:tautomerase family protein n=1 Tax=Streptomyces sp. CBMA123 TaxID=1896313 RepID=UPI0016621102|nr:tautomerase family protein [Streptomyces sp. CBMA123]MBD0695730.1 4-oxalocrotonate tautomerase [Streptomyces sp. CBMA123]